MIYEIDLDNRETEYKHITREIKIVWNQWLYQRNKKLRKGVDESYED